MTGRGWRHWLMYLYPRSLREAHGAEMVELLRRDRPGASTSRALRALGDMRFAMRDAATARRLARRPGQPGSSRDGGGGPRRGPLDALRVDGRYALRRLRQTPLFTAVAALSLGLGIGVNSAAFGVVSSFLFRPFPAENAEELVDVYMRDAGGFEYAPMSYLDLQDLRDQNEVFVDAAGARTFVAQGGPPEAPQVLLGELVSGAYFPLLGVRPAAGRLFDEADESGPGENPVAVLGHAFWMDRYGGDTGVLGQEIRINHRPYTIVGIAPAAFNGSFPGVRADLWAPLSMTDAVMGASSQGQLERRGSRSIFVKARMLPGTQPEQAHAAVDALSRRWSEDLPDTNLNRFMSAVPTNRVSLNPGIDGYLYPTAALLLVVVGLVLLVACTNLAGFLLARGEERQGEIGVRLALGATRGNLLRQLLMESLLLSALGGVVGWIFASWTIGAIQAFNPPMPIPINLDLRIDGRVMAWTATVSVLGALLFGTAPALQASRRDVASALRTRGDGGPTGRFSLRDAMVVAQVSLSLVLLVGASLFLGSLRQAQQTDPGFYTGTAAILWPNFEMSGMSPEESRDLEDRIAERLGALPGVTGIARTDRLPLGIGIQTTGTVIPGQPASADREAHDIDFAMASESYFEVMDVPMVEGRVFQRAEDESAPKVIVSEAFSRRFWPSGNALGQLITVSGAEREVVGVAADTKVRTIGETPRPYLYLPDFEPTTRALGLQFVVRGVRPSPALLSDAQQVFDELAPNVVMLEAKTMEQHLALLLYPPRAGAALLSLFGALALALASLGLYGIVSFSVSRRTREVGIRMSLGASPTGVVSLLLRSGMKLVAVGTIIGLLGALATSRLLDSFLFRPEAPPVGTWVGVPLLMATVALGAAWLSARRAGRVSPTA